nr:NAD(P)H-dependent oxidoreductase [Rubellimicrobium sp. CFH 75288]
MVHAHPAPDAFSAALLRAAQEGAESAGHAVRVLDLRAEGFDPVMGEAEWRGYHGPTADPVLRQHGEALLWAEGVILVFPTWWGGPPALLKGWLDRVWRPGLAFHEEASGLRPGLGHLRVLGVVTTLGLSRWAWSVALGAPGRRMLLRGLRVCTGARTRTLWLALHRVETVPAGTRERFLRHVRQRMARLR